MGGNSNPSFVPDEFITNENKHSSVIERPNIERKEGYHKRPWHQRYSKAFRLLAPISFENRDEVQAHYMPGPSRGFLSFLSLHWISPHMWKAFKGRLGVEDTWNLRPEDSSGECSQRLERHWTDQVARRGVKHASLTQALLRTFRTRIIFSSVAIIIGVAMQFIGPSILLALLMRFVNDGATSFSRGALIFSLIVLCQLMRTYFFYGLSMVNSGFTCFRASGALQLMLYSKVLRLRTSSDQILGKVVNICINDMDRLYEAFTAGPFIFSAIAMFICALTFNFYMIGAWSLLGFLIILLSYPILGTVAAVTSQLRLSVVQITDRRVNLISEILSAIRLIKMYAWEESFQKSVSEVRRQEHSILQKAAFLQSTSNTVSPIVGVLAALATLLGYVLSGNKLTSEIAFSVVSVFNAMQFSIGTLPYGIKMITEVHVALCRIQRMLLLPDLEEDMKPTENSEWALQIKNGSFAWEKSVVTKKTKGKRNGSSESLTKGSEEKNGTTAVVDQSDAKKTAKTNSYTSQNLQKQHLTGDAFNDKVKDPLEVNDLAKSDGPDQLINSVNVEGQAGDHDESSEFVPVLFELDVTVNRGSLVGVAGAVGSGKSSLLAAFLNQLRTVSGAVLRSGSVAVAPQTAWIFNASLRDNIVFGGDFDAVRYDRVLDVCALRPDLEQLENGDQTQIGERGVNLSGGQKQRVSLARAVYADADVYLMDDPLSAVDANVGRHIFERCIKGALAGKTVLLVSHGVQYLSRCDEVLMMHEGRLQERGTHAELMTQEAEYYRLVSHDTTAHQTNQTDSTKLEDQSAPTAQVENETVESRGSAVEAYQLELGVVQLLWHYCLLCGGWVMILVLTIVILFGAGRIASSIYLQHWLDEGDGLRAERVVNMTDYNMTYTEEQLSGYINDNPALSAHVAIYCGIVAVFIVLGLVKGIGVAIRVIKGSTSMHNTMFDGMMHCTVGYFDRNPSGRIINRFSRDLDELDNKIPMMVEFLLQSGAIILVQFLIPVAAFPILIILVILASVLYYVLGKCLMSGIRETKHLENIVRAPVVQQLASTVSGLAVIRVFNKQNLFSQRFERLLDRHTSASLEYRLSVTWFSMRVEEVSLFMLSVISLCVLVFGGVSPAIAGLVISSVYGWITFLSFWMQLVVDMGARLTAVERCEQFVESQEREAAWNIDASSSVSTPVDISSVQSGPDSQWPSAGAIELHSVVLRYRPQLAPALRGLTVSIDAGHKVGIVGRTGAGKSTLVSTMLRLTELEEGSVFIDGIDIRTLGLHHLRAKIAVIPQDPVLFSGTVRYNLDPFSQYGDDRLWDVLEKANLKKKVSRSKLQLQMIIAADGDNFSVGERQLVCLARALLRQNRILLLDEATASIDVKTDRIIQQTIRDSFSTCTVLTIAHRLNTVASYDRIMVMQTGKVTEYDAPLALMERDESHFRRMMADSGVTSVEQFRQIQTELNDKNHSQPLSN